MKKVFFSIIALVVLGLGAWVLFLRAPTPRSQQVTPTFSDLGSQPNYKPITVEVIFPPNLAGELPSQMEMIFLAWERIENSDDQILSRTAAVSVLANKGKNSYAFKGEIRLPKGKIAFIKVKAPKLLTYPLYVTKTQIESGRVEIPLAYIVTKKYGAKTCGAPSSDSIEVLTEISSASKKNIKRGMRYHVFLTATSSISEKTRDVAAGVIVPIASTELLGDDLIASNGPQKLKLKLGTQELQATASTTFSIRAINCPANLKADECFNYFRGQKVDVDTTSLPFLYPSGFIFPRTLCGGDKLNFKMVFWNSETEPASKVFE